MRKFFQICLTLIAYLLLFNQQVFGNILFYENFDSVTPPNLPSNWDKIDVAGSQGDWNTNGGTVHPQGYQSHSSPNLAYFNSWSANGISTRLFYNQSILLPSTSKTELSLWMFHDTGFSSANDRLKLQVSTDNGANWSDIGNPILRYDGSSSWKLHTFDLSSYAGQNILIGLLGISGYGNDIHVDDIMLYETLYKNNNLTTLQPGPGKNDDTDDGSPSKGKESGFTHSGGNAGSSPYMFIYNSPCNVGLNPAYIQFHTANLPNANIANAEIMLYVKVYFNGYGWPWTPGTYQISLRRVTSNWNEMSITKTNMPTQNSQIIAFNTFTAVGGGSWGNAYTEFEGWMSFDITELYRGWVNGSIPNYGVVVSLDDAICANGNEILIYSSDYDDITLRPKLVITEGFNLTLIKSGVGSGTITSSPSGVNCGSDCTEGYPSGTTVTLKAIAASNSTFAGWGGDCSTCGTNTTCNVTMDADKTCSATFTLANQYTLSVTPVNFCDANTSGGIITSNDGFINCGTTCSYTYNSPRSIELTALPHDGYSFMGWSDGSSILCGTTADCNFYLNRSISVRAVFSQPLPTPTTTGEFEEFAPVVNPSCDRPIGVGLAYRGTGLLDLRLMLPGFITPMDLYLGIYAPDLDSQNIYVVKPNGDFETFRGINESIIWKSNVTGTVVSQPLLKWHGSPFGISVPSGRYELYLLALPSGNYDGSRGYYLWKTVITVN